MIPPSKPRITSAEIERILAANNTRLGLTREDDGWPMFIIGIRGYYLRTMGVPTANDRGIYDDAIIIHTANVTACFNGNTDPSRRREGWGTGANKGMANLNPGLWAAYRFDYHRGQYLALCQRAAPVTVTRDGSPPYEDTGYFGINIHRGGYNTTSSEGCQTLPPNQWPAFIALAESEAIRIYGNKLWKSSTIPYLLIENRQ